MQQQHQGDGADGHDEGASLQASYALASQHIKAHIQWKGRGATLSIFEI
jgi:hypothetical protein